MLYEGLASNVGNKVKPTLVFLLVFIRSPIFALATPLLMGKYFPSKIKSFTFKKKIFTF